MGTFQLGPQLCRTGSQLDAPFGASIDLVPWRPPANVTNVTLDDGIHTSYAATPTDYDRAFKGYPELAPFRGNPLPLELTLEPGQSVEGDILASFRLTKEEWDARKGLDFTFGFRYQPLLKMPGTGPVADK